MSNFLQDYMDRRRQEQREDEQSPEDLLEAVANNMERVAAMNSSQIDIHIKQGSAVIGGLDSVKLAQTRQTKVAQQASKAADATLDKLVDLQAKQVAATSDNTDKVSDSLRDINNTLKNLVQQLRPKNKHDKAYDPVSPAAAAAKAQSNSSSSGLFDLFDAFDGDGPDRRRDRGRGRGRGGRGGTRSPSGRGAGRLGRIAQGARGALGGVAEGAGKFASKAGGVMGKLAVPLAVAMSAGNAIWEGSKEDSTERYAKRFGTDTNDLGDGSFGSMAKFAALRAGGAATDVAQALDPSALWNEKGDSWTDRLLRDRREDAGKEGSLFSGGAMDSIGTTIGRATALAMAPVSEDARKALGNDWRENFQPSLQKVTKAMGDIPDKFAEATSALSNKFEDFGKQFEEGLEGVSAAGSSIWGGIKVAANTMLEGGKGAAANVKEGWDKRGLAGAIQSAPQAAKSIASGGKKAMGQLSDATQLAGAQLGVVSEKYESGGRGVGTISSGKGDKGGVSYGKHQLATNNGSMGKFLSSEEGKQFAAKMGGLQPGTPEFNAKYKELTTGEGGKEMEAAQHAYMQRTHFNPQSSKLAKDLGIDVGKESRGFQEAVWSTATQYGPNSDTITKAFKGKDFSKMSDAEKISTIQDYKAANVDKNFKSSSEGVRASISKRIASEKQTLLAINEEKAGSKVGEPQSGKIAMSASQLATKPVSESPTQQFASIDAKKLSPTVSSEPTINRVYKEPEQKVAANAPQEVSQVQVSNAAEIGAGNKRAEGPVQVPGGGQQVAANNVPDLNSLPLQISDLGLVLLNIGHV